MVLDAHAERVYQDGEEYALLEVLVVNEGLGPAAQAAKRAHAVVAALLEAPTRRRPPPLGADAVPGLLGPLLVLHVAAARADLRLGVGQPLRPLLQHYVPVGDAWATTLALALLWSLETRPRKSGRSVIVKITEYAMKRGSRARYVEESTASVFRGVENARIVPGFSNEGSRDSYCPTRPRALSLRCGPCGYWIAFRNCSDNIAVFC